MYKLREVLSGRLARNVYFWGILIYTRLGFGYTWDRVAYTTLLFLLMMVLFYVNNLLLIPRYLSAKRYVAYLLRYLSLTAAVSLCYVGVIKVMLHFHPGYHPGAVSPLVVGGETGSLRFETFFTEGVQYFVWLFFAGGVFAMSWYVMDYQRQQKQLEQTRKKHLEMELQFLKSQINPHFLFNTMNNLYALTVKKSDLAPEVVSKISTLLRYFLYESDKPEVSFDKEKEIMQAYIDLELLRISDTSHMHFHIHADKPYSIPPLLWVPILENAFKHGTRYISDGHHIDYRFTIEQGIMHIHCTNGYKAEQTQAATGGIGLTNLAQRLKLLFPGNYSVNMQQENGKFIADVNINLPSA